ncbi:DUF2867 domain-containing protein [Heliobacterium undosum]|uniref:DUF2867 domain-containing protein n=1 Tax=Heliomicrobium undosum TaxID=121734 RepID=A0A845L2B2_9FIRM|nr:DUF2867 domain-containing protein [Heliomicrobium undosum]MZP30393.1 DUF2867 domain-containing protein [Heliomicrobium undosum]
MCAVSVAEVPIPQDALVAASLQPIHYGDCYRMQVPKNFTGGVDDLTGLIFSPASNPSWASGLTKVRDSVVGLFGIKRVTPGPGAAKQGDSLQPGQRRLLFPIIARTDTELLLGLDDRHLDFRVSVRLVEEGANRSVDVATVVKFHNLLGRAYFVPVKPFHRLLVPAIMKKAALNWEMANTDEG